MASGDRGIRPHTTPKSPLGRQQRGACPLWIFMHSTDIVDRCFIVLFFSLLLFFGLFPVCPSPPGNFSADALDPAIEKF